MKDTLAQVYVNTEYKNAFKLKEEYQTLESVRANLWQVRGDRGFLKIIRRIAPTFPQYEKKNIYKYDLGNWYNMIDLTRHQIVHSRQQATDLFLSDLKKKGYWNLFNENFTISAGNNPLLIITYNQASHILSNFIEYAYLIFKCLSQDLHLPYDSTLPTNKSIQNIFNS